MVETLTLTTLLQQTPESRERDVIRMLTKQLDLQLEHPLHDLHERLADAGFVGTRSEALANMLGHYFPFLTSPMTLVEKSTTFADLVRLICQKVGNL